MPLRIDEGELLEAISDHSSEWYLDRETGEVFPNGIEAFMHGDPEYAFYERVANDPRYVMVEPVASGTGYDWMADFIEGLSDARARRTLMHAIEGKRPFRRFKDALGEFPEVREAWFAFEADRLRGEATAWLREEGIDAVLVDRRAGPPAAE